MNKLYKCALGLLTTFILTCCCFSSAIENTRATINWSQSYGWSNGSVDTTNLSVGETMCFSVPCNNASVDIGDGYVLLEQGLLYCYNYSQASVVKLKNNCGSSQSFNYVRSKGGMGGGYIMPSECSAMSSLECQTEYNLIPISEVTANYCKLNFDLIDPMDCPINEGTGAIVRSNLTINNTPYAQNQNINVFIPDFLAWNVAFNDFNTVIEVEGYNADESYIEGVINNEKLTPTNEDITLLFTGLVNFIPYLFIGLLIIRTVKIFNRIWR